MQHQVVWHVMSLRTAHGCGKYAATGAQVKLYQLSLEPAAVRRWALRCHHMSGMLRRSVAADEGCVLCCIPWPPAPYVISKYERSRLRSPAADGRAGAILRTERSAWRGATKRGVLEVQSQAAIYNYWDCLNVWTHNVFFICLLLPTCSAPAPQQLLEVPPSKPLTPMRSIPGYRNLVSTCLLATRRLNSGLVSKAGRLVLRPKWRNLHPKLLARRRGDSCNSICSSVCCAAC